MKGSRGILFKKNNHLDFLAYTDVDRAGDRNDRRSTSEYIRLLEGNLVKWKSKKQKVVALSSAEAKFRGTSKGITEIIWLQKLMNVLHLPLKKGCNMFCNKHFGMVVSISIHTFNIVDVPILTT